LRGQPPGDVIKCFAIYDRPFWRDRRLSGSVVSTEGPVHVVFDATPPESAKGRGILMAFLEARTARHWKEASAEARRETVLSSLGRFFGREALSPSHYVDHAWATEAWSRGCYVGLPKRGVLTSFGAILRQPHHGIHWAGTETATHWNGYIEGAVRSGERAAKEILQVGVRQ
jgi:monoamine oxidase